MTDSFCPAGFIVAGCMSRSANAVRSLVDDLVLGPMKGVTSSDMLRVVARRR